MSFKAVALSLVFLVAQGAQADSLFKMRKGAKVTGDAGIGGGDSGLQLRASVGTELDTGTRVEGIVEGGFPLLRLRGKAEHDIPLAVTSKKLNDDGTLEISLVPLTVAGKAVFTALNPENSPVRQQLMITPQAIAKLAYFHPDNVSAAAIRFRVGPTVGLGADGDGAGYTMGANSGLDLTASINLGEEWGIKNKVEGAAEGYCLEKIVQQKNETFDQHFERKQKCIKEQTALRSKDKIALDLAYSIDHLQAALGNVESGIHSQSVNVAVRHTNVTEGVNAIGIRFVGDRFDVQGEGRYQDTGVAHGLYLNASGVW